MKVIILDSNTPYQQTTEYEQYTYSYNEPRAQSYEAQNVNYTYGITPYQDYEQQQQSEAPVNYENYDQMNYATERQSYDQQLTISQDYAQKPIEVQDYGQQSAELYGYDTSQYDQSQGYGYDNYYAQSYMPSANEQTYSNQTESYTGEIFRFNNIQ